MIIKCEEEGVKFNLDTRALEDITKAVLKDSNLISLYKSYDFLKVKKENGKLDIIIDCKLTKNSDIESIYKDISNKLKLKINEVVSLDINNIYLNILEFK